MIDAVQHGRYADLHVRFGPLRGDDEGKAIADILARAFAFPSVDAVPWLEKSGLENVRVLRDGDRPVACLLLVPMGQWFGGRSVRTVGVAGVAVDPGLRGRGAAAALMTAALREQRAAGCPLSTLYPATQVLYRKVGYEQAGGRFEVSVPAAALVSRDLGRARGMGARGSAEVRRIEEADRDDVMATYRTMASACAGYLDRGPYVWGRVFQPRGEPAFGYAIGKRGALQGYVYLQQRRIEGGKYDLALSDLCASTPRAWQRLIRFLADHRSMGEQVRWACGPTSPSLALLAEQSYSLRLAHHWMLRIVDVAAALRERGYPAGFEGELHLGVRDEILRDNAGSFVLEVSGGRGHVRTGGRRRVELHVRGLAALYAGYLGASALRAMGWLEASDRDCAIADAIFAGGGPGMPDMF